MGVSAIFVSTLAVTELPAPRSPPQSQAELLAATLQTIVGFVVLCSIVVRTCLPHGHALCRRRDTDTTADRPGVDGLSVPLLCYGRDIGARTLTLTRTWTSRRGNGNTSPDWLIGIRHGSTIGTVRMGNKAACSGDVEQNVHRVESVAGSDSTGEEKSGEGSLEEKASGPEVIVVEVPSRQSPPPPQPPSPLILTETVVNPVRHHTPIPRVTV